MSEQNRLTTEKFLADVAGHVMTIEHDDGIHRTLHFGQPGSSDMHFRLTTFSGHLCYSGDMGTYVFSRLRDMFEFFRREKLGINTHYWSEKLEAVDRSSDAIEYDHSAMVAVVQDRLNDWTFDDSDQEKEVRDEINALLEEISGCNSADIPIDKIMSCRPDGAEEIFDEIWEHSFTRATRRMDWCMFAIVWGIQQYDAAKAIESAA